MEPCKTAHHGRRRRAQVHWRLRVSSFVVATVVAITAFAGVCAARPSDGGICIDPDIEFPVPCDEDED